ncbi:MAG: preprotein translocase subunit SecE [bacterium]
MSFFNRLRSFLKKVWLEAKPGGRVNWPSTQKLIESTMLVLACAVFFMVYIGLLDLIFGQLFLYLTYAFQ